MANLCLRRVHQGQCGIGFNTPVGISASTDDEAQVCHGVPCGDQRNKSRSRVKSGQNGVRSLVLKQIWPKVAF